MSKKADYLVVPKKIAHMRNELMKLDFNKPGDFAEYVKIRDEFIIAHEGFKKDVYEIGGIPHVGVGFNMGTKGSKRRDAATQEWAAAFGKEKGHKPDFENVLKGEQKLSEAEVKTLFNYSMSARRETLKGYFDDAWDKLKPNEKLVVESMYFNGGEGLVIGRQQKEIHKGKERVKLDKNNKPVWNHTNFFKNMVAYAHTGNKENLSAALNEVKNRSNASKSDGLSCRRDLEAMMLNTCKIPQYEVQKMRDPTNEHRNRTGGITSLSLSDALKEEGSLLAQSGVRQAELPELQIPSSNPSAIQPSNSRTV